MRMHRSICVLVLMAARAIFALPMVAQQHVAVAQPDGSMTCRFAMIAWPAS